MESEIEQAYISSPYFDKSTFQKQLEVIKKISDIAQERIDYASAHDDHILHAIEVVENFLRKKHRLCYGGQAINAHLPAKYKFYDPEYSIPDYDFFTPTPDSDISMIINDLRKAGFVDISAREGMHEGTTKIYVEYIPVADITMIDPNLYRILSKREFRNDGISYLDVNTLRMLMYLELSRPRGEVQRWEKVFERLLLLNTFSPPKKCKSADPLFKTGLQKDYAKFTLDYIIQQKRIFAGADLSSFYQDAVRKHKMELHWIFGTKKPILFYSSTPHEDARYLSTELTHRFGPRKSLTVKSVASKGIDTPPPMEIICYGKSPLIFIIHESECHSYFDVPLDKHKNIRIASMDTLITLYFSLGLVKSSYFDVDAMECLANHLVHISNNARKQGDHFIFPFISIDCSGHQTTLPSLIRAKVQRITKKREHMKTLLAASNSKRTTRKN
jgi:Poly(A) polymerase catalytic subunit